jgi:hypothetical protein
MWMKWRGRSSLCLHMPFIMQWICPSYYAWLNPLESSNHAIELDTRKASHHRLNITGPSPTSQKEKKQVKEIWQKDIFANTSLNMKKEWSSSTSQCHIERPDLALPALTLVSKTEVAYWYRSKQSTREDFSTETIGGGARKEDSMAAFQLEFVLVNPQWLVYLWRRVRIE